MVDIKIRDNACRGCEMCIKVCPTDVFEHDSGSHRASVKNPDQCIACLSCSYICPSGAVTQADYPVVTNFYRDLDFCGRMAMFQ